MTTIVTTKHGMRLADVNVGSSSDRQPVELRASDLLSDLDWDRSVLSHPQATLFHTAAWAQVLNKTYGHKALGLRLVEGGETLGMVPMMDVNSPLSGRRGVAMPFSDFCQPLAFARFDSALLVERLLSLARERGWRYFELRGGREILPSPAAASERYYGHRLDLTVGAEKLFARFSAPVRRAIRKAQQSDLVVEINNSAEATSDFYRLHLKTRKRLGVPPQSFAFFRNIWREVLQRNLGFIVLAKRAMTPVAAAVFFRPSNVALFKFGASDQKLQGLRGNNLVMWEGIQRLVGLGAQSLHFGRTALNNDGLRRFKLSWGAEEESVDYFKFAVRPQDWLTARRNGSELITQIFRRLPSSFNRFVGTLIYPHLD